MTYNMHPTYAAYALRTMLAGKRVLVLVDRARERRDTLNDIMNTAHEIGLTDADNGLDLGMRLSPGNESVHWSGSRAGNGCIVFALAQEKYLRGHSADLILHPGISHYLMVPILAVRAGTSERYHRDTPRPEQPDLCHGGHRCTAPAECRRNLRCTPPVEAA